MTRRLKSRGRKGRTGGLLLLAPLAAALSLPARSLAHASSSLGFLENMASKAGVVSEGFQLFLADLRLAVELPRELAEIRARAQTVPTAAPAPAESACKVSRSTKASL